MTKQLLVLILILFSISGYSQKITGKITDTNGNAIPFANIYCKKLASGTTSNINGQYQLKLPNGEWMLQFRYLGYKTKDVKVAISDNNLEMDVSLASQNYQLKEVKVLSSGEDPAYFIMRKAIAMGEYYTKQVSEYDNIVYLKGSGKVTSVPRLLKNKLAKEDITVGKSFVTENISKIHFELPDKIEEEVISMRSSSIDEQANPMQFITENLYNTRDDGFISPLDKTAFSVYTFQLESVFEDQGRMINKIKVTPKRKGKDLFSGYLNIAEIYWNLHSADLKLSLPMTEVHMHQLYAPITDDVWMPVSFDFNIKFNGLGFGLNGMYVASIKDYKLVLNPDLDHDYLRQQEIKRQQEEQIISNLTNDKESKVLSVKEVKRKNEIQNLVQKEDMNNSDMRKLYRLMEKENQNKRKEKIKEPLEIKIDKVKIAKNAKDKDSLYWAEMRPIPLSGDEKNSFTKKDSIKLIRSTPEYKDSVRRANREFKFKHILFGKTYTYKEENSKLSIPALLSIGKISYNTVQGFTFNAPFKYNWKDTLGHYLEISPDFTYGFSRKHLDFSVGSRYRYNGFKRSWIGFKAGSETLDFNSKTGIDPFLNATSSLFFKDNYLKLYDKTYVRMWHKLDISNGLSLYTNLEYARRKQLYNTNTWYISNPDHKDYTSNIPEGSNPESLRGNHSFSITAKLEYTPRNQYYLRDGVKNMIYFHNQPTFGLTYKQGFKNAFNSETDYTYIETSVKQGLNIGFNDRIEYKIKAGTFLSNKQSFFADYHHFNTSKPMVEINNTWDSFRLLDYYRYSTTEDYLEAHLQYTSDRLFLKRLPILNNSMSINEHFFANYLTHANKQNYWEVGYGLSQIFLVLDVEVFWSFNGKNHQDTGLKLKFNF